MARTPRPAPRPRGRPVVADPRRTRGISLRASTYAALQARAAAEGRTVSDLVESVLSRWIAGGSTIPNE